MIKVIKAGIYSSIQDGGRFGYRDCGVPISGFMDAISANQANLLVNNSYDAAVLEMAYVGCELKFLQDTFISITGAVCEILLDDRAVTHNQLIAVKQGERLKFNPCRANVYVYLAVAGGFQTEKTLNSRSFYHRISKQAQLYHGDMLAIKTHVQPILNRCKVAVNSQHLNSNKIKVTPGPEYDRLDKSVKKQIFTHKFKLSPQSNRMAYKLISNSSVKLYANEIITSAVQAGTVQLTPAGELIVLMRDAQTTGGYARVLQLSENAINQLVQIPAGRTIYFNL